MDNQDSHDFFKNLSIFDLANLELTWQSLHDWSFNIWSSIAVVVILVSGIWLVNSFESSDTPKDTEITSSPQYAVQTPAPQQSSHLYTDANGNSYWVKDQ